ncbi:GNAT family N-acetyltransferase [Aeromonas diversa]|uniref:GNAT family N-acetyltransferase n=1 Tax=Aeromonas diversa TaxID=502790 RepID=UPI003461D21D
MREREAGCLCLREATSSDLAAIVRLERYMFPPEIAFGRERWRYLLNRAKGTVWLLHDAKGELMAYLCVLEHRGWRRLVVQTLAVHWRLRREGWGRWLMMQLIEWARTQGWRGIRLEVSERNEEGLALYDGLGFRQESLLRDYYGPRHHGQRRVLSL